MKVDVFEDEVYLEKMEKTVKPWLDENLFSGYCPGKNNFRLHYLRLLQKENARGTLVILHGFCGFSGKFHELMYYFYNEGYNIFFLEQRGHGYSGREIDDPSLIHVHDFMDYVEDLKVFMDETVKKEEPNGPYYLYAHSMGGLVAALFLENYPGYFTKSILSSPMLGIDFGKFPDPVVSMLAIYADLAGKEKNYLPGHKPWNGAYSFSTSNTSCEPRSLYQFRLREQDTHYQTCAGTYGWAITSREHSQVVVRDACNIDIPVLIVQAKDDTMVENKDQDAFVKVAPHARLCVMNNTKHEIYNAAADVIRIYYDIMFAFLLNNNEEDI